MSFFDESIDISKIDFCCFVGKGKGTKIHRDRKSYGIVFIISGEKNYKFESFGTVSTKKNDVLFLPKGSSYCVDTITEGECIAANFDFFEYRQYEPFTVKIKNVTEIEESFKQIVQFWENKKQGYEMKCRSLLYNIIYLVQREYCLKYGYSEKARLIKAAVERITEDCTANKLTIGELASLCNISETYFREIFVNAYGISPVKYINALKLKHAAELLKSEYYSVGEAMTMSGFNDMAYFSRAFKRYFGISPKQYQISGGE